MPFTEASVPDVSGRVFVITGGNSGIGYEAARVILRRGGRVVLACRDAGKMSAAKQQLANEVPGAVVDEVVLDLSSLASIEKAARELAQMRASVDVLVNNAGVMALPERATADGFEMQFGTNHLGPFAFTGRVLPLVRAAKRGRVVTVSSFLHARGHIDFDAIPKPQRYDEDRQYNMSKLANVLFSYELHRRLRASTSAIALACHPGYSATNLFNVGPQMKQSSLLGGVMKAATALAAQSAAMGALGTLYASTGDVDGGEYIGPTGLFNTRGHPVKAKSSPESYDAAVAARLWEVSERLTGVTYAFGP